MKKSTAIWTIIFLVVIAGLVGIYAFLSGRAKSETDAVMTPVQTVLSRDLDRNYPATVKEVVKYYTDLEKCFYNEECTEEEIESLGLQARRLYDRELCAANEVETYLLQLKTDILRFKGKGRRIAAAAVASSNNVNYFEADGYEFARIHCGYTVSENGVNKVEGRVYLLRRDEQRRWKIYGWDNAENVDPK